MSCLAPLIPLLVATVVGCGVPAASGAPPASLAIEGCERIQGSLSRCEMLVRLAAAELAPDARSMTSVTVLPPNDRQRGFDQQGHVVANVVFAFADGSSQTIAMACPGPHPTDLACAPR